MPQTLRFRVIYFNYQKGNGDLEDSVLLWFLSGLKMPSEQINRTEWTYGKSVDT